ncbi:unnamed protein product [Symbiodinium sp. CCMP2592]|nr:unnamed protein product [Symbiodinium sp. CCMP2592]
MLHLAERVGSYAACSVVKLQLRKLVLQASAFSHILDLEEGPSTADVFGHPLWKLSPSRRGTVLQDVTRAVLQRAYPDSQFHDPVPGNFDSGRARHLQQAQWDWTMDGRRVECKSASLSWSRQRCQWRALFSGVKLAHDGFRQHALFDDLLLVLLSPDSLDIVQHDLRTRVSTAGHRTGPTGSIIKITGARRQPCWKEARKQILGKLCEGQGSCVPVAQVLLSDPCIHSTLQKHLSRYPAMACSHTPFDSLPLSLLSPPMRGLRIQQIALEIDQMLHPDADFSIVCEGTTASGARRSSQNASVDWVRNETSVEVKHGKLNFESKQKRWKCTFRAIKCAFPGTRSRDLYDELWLVMYSSLGLHFMKHHGQLGLSTNGVMTEVSGHVLQVYGPSKEEDSRAAAHVILAKLLHRGCVLLATVWWDSNMSHIFPSDSSYQLRPQPEKESAPETTNSEEENSSDLEGWVEAQTARSSRLMQLFEKEHRRMNATADKLADRRQLIERESRCIDALEAAEHEHQQGLDKLHEVVAQLSSRCRKADDGPQYFYIGDSEVETQAVSPSSTAGQITPAQSKPPAGLPQLNLSGCRENIERSVASAEDAWEERRRVLQEQAQSREARRAELPAAEDSAIRKTPLMSPRRMAGSGRKRQSSGGSQSLREAHGMILRQLSPPKEQALPGETEDFGEVLSRESSKLSDEVPLSLDPSASQLEMLQEPEPTAEEPLEAVEDPEPTAADPLAAAEDPEASAEEPLEAAEEIETAADEPPVEAWPPPAAVAELQAAEEAAAGPEEPPCAEPAAVVEKAPRSATEDSAEEHLTLMGESSNAGSWSRMVSEEEDVPTDGTLETAVGAADLDPLEKGFVRHSSTEDADAKASAWVSNKSFPKPLGGEAGEECTLQQKSSKELLDPCEGSAEPGTIAFVIPEPMPEEPVEDSELTRALSKRRQQVENSHCEFTKEGLNSRADMSWKQSAKASTGSIGVFTKEGIHSPADIPRSSPRYSASKFRTSSK